MQWHDTNPHGPNASFTQKANFAVHREARAAFAGSFARGGGLVPTMFAPTAKEAFLTPWKRQHKVGSEAHIRNLEQMLAKDPNSEGIQKALKSAKSSTSKLGMLGRVGGGALAGAFVVLPAFITPGSGVEKARATAGGVAGLGGWALGTKLGAGTGAAIGSAIFPGVGTAIGAVAGAVIGGITGAIGFDMGFQELTRIPDRMVERERSRRKLDWVGDKRAFQTQRASTMRQQSMEMMNRGMMSARSMLGREGVMLHQ